MANTPYTVLVVDDEAPNRLLMETALRDEYTVITAESGAECLDYLANHPVDLIIMDVRMPNMTGYEACSAIKGQFSTKDIPVIFLSAHTDLEDKLKGYEAGGDDYLTKPCELKEVFVKVKTQIALKESLANTKNMAMMAITNSSELGMVNHFYESSFSCETVEKLAQQIIDTCHSFDLECSLQIRNSSDVFNASSTRNQCTVLEIDLIEQIRDADRIIHFGKRTAFNFDNVSLIIKNMPRDDESKCGRLNDHLASLLNGAEARIESIDIEIAQRKAVLDELKIALGHVNSAVRDVEDGIKARQKKTAGIIASLFDEMHVGFSSLALSEEQEEFFVGLVNNHMDKVISLFTSNTDVEKHFISIANDITRLMKP